MNKIHRFGNSAEIDEKNRVRMYKKGKHWVTASQTSFMLLGKHVLAKSVAITLGTVALGLASGQGASASVNTATSNGQSVVNEQTAGGTQNESQTVKLRPTENASGGGTETGLLTSNTEKQDNSATTATTQNAPSQADTGSSSTDQVPESNNNTTQVTAAGKNDSSSVINDAGENSKAQSGTITLSEMYKNNHLPDLQEKLVQVLESNNNTTQVTAAGNNNSSSVINDADENSKAQSGTITLSEMYKNNHLPDLQEKLVDGDRAIRTTEFHPDPIFNNTKVDYNQDTSTKTINNVWNQNYLNFNLNTYVSKELNLGTPKDGLFYNLQIDDRLAKHITSIEITNSQNKVIALLTRAAARKAGQNIGDYDDDVYCAKFTDIFPGSDETRTASGVIHFDGKINDILSQATDNDFTKLPLGYRSYVSYEGNTAFTTTSLLHGNQNYPSKSILGASYTNGFFITPTQHILDSGKDEGMDGGYIGAPMFYGFAQKGIFAGGTDDVYYDVEKRAIVIDNYINRKSKFTYNGNGWKYDLKIDPRLLPFIKVETRDAVTSYGNVERIYFKNGTFSTHYTREEIRNQSNDATADLIKETRKLYREPQDGEFVADLNNVAPNVKKTRPWIIRTVLPLGEDSQGRLYTLTSILKSIFENTADSAKQPALQFQTYLDNGYGKMIEGTASSNLSSFAELANNVSDNTEDQGLFVIDFVDENQTAQGAFTLEGKTGSTQEFTADFPDGWTFAGDPSKLPNGWTINSQGQLTGTATMQSFNSAQATWLLVKHNHVVVTSDKPQADGTQIPNGAAKFKGVSDKDLNQTLTRTITVNDPRTGVKTITQKAKISRNATVDMVDGSVVYGDWSTAEWPEYTVPTVNGYTPSQATVKSKTVANGDKDDTVTIDYTADKQTAKIVYVDENGQTVKSDTVTGVTDQDAKVNSSVPTGWKLIDGQTIPTTIKLGVNTPDTTIKVGHDHVSISHDNPQADDTQIPNGAAKFKGVSDKDLNQTLTRTITVNDPHTGVKTITQTAKIYRDATVDMVDGSVVYGDWSTAEWPEYTVPTVNGYTPSQATVKSKTVANGDKDDTVTIDYTADKQTAKIVYVDENGQTVKSDTVTGVTDQDAKVNSSVPTGWKLIDGQTIPTTIKLGVNTPDTTIKVGHDHVSISHDNPQADDTQIPNGAAKFKGVSDKDLNQTLTRTITVNDPHTGVKTITQTAKIYRDATVDMVDGSVVYGDWSTAEWPEYTVPTVNGYTPSQATVKSKTVANGDKDDTVTIDYTADKQTAKIVYVDKDGNTIKTDTVTGVTDQDAKVNSSVPTGWKLIDGQTIPTTIKLGVNTPDTVVKVEHDHVSISHDNPQANDTDIPGGTAKFSGVDDSDLNQTLTRTITVNDPHTGVKTITQTAKIYRDATVDMVDGSVVYGDWSTAEWPEYTVPTVNGYTPSQATVKSKTVANGDKDDTVTIDYTADKQTAKIVYVDKDGNTIKTDTVTGVTDQDAKVNSFVPTGWKLVDGQMIPTTIELGVNTPDTVVKVEHDHVSISHDNPQANDTDIPGGTAKFSGVDDSDLNQTLTRTITVNDPHTGVKTITQTAKISRNATVDMVDGSVVYGDWSTAEWPEYIVPTVDGYTPSQATVEKKTVVNGDKDDTVTIDYTADKQTAHVIYVDENGNQVKSDDVDGHTDETVKVTSKVPAGWVLADGQSVPKSITFGAVTSDAKVVVKHGHVTVTPDAPKTSSDKLPDNSAQNYPSGVDYNDLNKTITRTINVHNLDGTVTPIVQTAHLTRTADVDEVDGTVTYGEWTTGSWNKFVSTPIDGYTASLTELPAAEVNSATADASFDVIYTANSQSMRINYVDENGQTVDSTIVNGHTDETVTTNSKVPAGWKLVDGQNVPKEITFKGAKTDDVTVKVEHAHVTVTPDAPKTASDKLPDNADKNYPSGVDYNDLNKTVKRTITVHNVDGTTTIVEQEVHFTRTADVDEVDGTVEYGSWQADKQFDQYAVPVVPGYVSMINGKEQTMIQPAMPTVDDNDSTIDVTYQAVDGSQTIDYVDENDTVIGYQIITGKTAETKPVKSAVPAGWKLADGQTVPDTVTIKANDVPVKVSIEHDHVAVSHDNAQKDGTQIPNGAAVFNGVADNDLNQTLTRTITINDPHEGAKTITQTAKIYRDATVDMVTGEVVYTGWQTDGNSSFAKVPIDNYDGYTPRYVVNGNNANSEALNEVIPKYDENGDIVVTDGGIVVKNDNIDVVVDYIDWRALRDAVKEAPKNQKTDAYRNASDKKAYDNAVDAGQKLLDELNDKNAGHTHSQDEIDAAVNRIKNALDGKPTDKSQLEKDVNRGNQTKQDDVYKNADKDKQKVLDDVLKQGQDVLNDPNADQKTVDEADQAIKEAIKNLDGQPTDKSQLQKDVDQGKQSKQNDAYKNADKDKKEALDNAIKQGQDVLNDPNADQKTVNDVDQAIKEAIKNLDGQPTDKDQLQKDVNQGSQTKQDDAYKNANEDKQKALDDAIKYGQDVLNDPNVDQKTVDEADQAIKEAIKNLDGQPTDKSQLEKDVEQGNQSKQDDQYRNADQDKQKTLDDAIKHGQDVLNDPNAAQKTVDDADQAIKEALKNLDGQPTDKSQLQKDIDQGSQIKQGDQYRNADQDKQTALDDAIKYGQDVLNDPNADQKTVDDADQAIKDAIKNLNGRPTNKDQLQKDVDQGNQTKQDDAYKNADEDKQKALYDAIKHGQDVLNDPNADQKTVDEADQAIKDAIKDLNGQPTDKDQLQKDIDQGNQSKQNDTYKNADEDKQKVLDDAIKHGQDVLNDPNADQKTVNDADQAIKDAIKDLNGQSTDKDQLQKDVDQGKQTKQDDQYRNADQDKQKALDDAIKHGQDVLNDPNADQKTVNDADQAIKDAIKDLNGQSTDKNQLQKDVNQGSQTKQDDAYKNADKDKQEALDSAIKQGQDVLNDPNADQKTVNDADQAIKDALKNLNGQPTDKSQLQKDVDQGTQIKQDDTYKNADEDNQKVLDDAIKHGQDVLNDPNADQKTVNDADQAIKDAIKDLNGQPTDKGQLQKNVDQGTQIKQDDAYKNADKEKQKALDDAIKHGQDVLNDPNVDQKTVDDADQAIKDAIKDLNGQPTDKDQLQKDVDQGNQIKQDDTYKNADEDKQKALDDAIKHGQDVLNDPNADQKTVDEAVAELEKAIKTIEAEFNNGENAKNVNSQGRDGGVNGSNHSVATTNQKQNNKSTLETLPQTGNQQSAWAVLAGLIATVMSSLMMLLGIKKGNDDKEKN